jgi:hypothetical protein
MGKAEERVATGLVARLSIGRVAGDERRCRCSAARRAVQYSTVRCKAGREVRVLRPVCTSIAVPMKRVIDLYHRLEKAKSGGDAVLSVVRRWTYT